MTWKLRTCMHGVQEELDWHDCPGCEAIAEELGLKWIDRRQTYIYMEMPVELTDEKAVCECGWVDGFRVTVYCQLHNQGQLKEGLKEGRDD